MRKFVPTFKNHLARYSFALGHCYKQKVIDIGCKQGFGTHILSYGANELFAVDIDNIWLDQAKNHYKYFCPVKFFNVDLDSAFLDDTFDVGVCFEVMEHVNNPEFLVQNIAQHCKKLIFSVPHMVANHEHKTLFDEQKIRELIGKYFTIDEFYVQDKEFLNNHPLYKGLKCYVGVATSKLCLKKSP